MYTRVYVCVARVTIVVPGLFVRVVPLPIPVPEVMFVVDLTREAIRRFGPVHAVQTVIKIQNRIISCECLLLYYYLFIVINEYFFLLVILLVCFNTSFHVNDHHIRYLW